MDRYNRGAGSASAPSAPAAADNPYFTEGNPTLGVPATQPGPWWFHMITEELRAVIVAAGLTPDHEDLDQLSEAIQALIEAGLAPAASETVSGIVELATSAEAQAGTDTARAVTPAGIRAAINAVGSAPIYAVRAWVRTSNTTGAIAASGNVSSVGNPSTGRFTINFTTALPDANYAYSFTHKALNAFGSADLVSAQHNSVAPTASLCDFMVRGMTSFNGNNVELSAIFVR
jgi:hypothetical protein